MTFMLQEREVDGATRQRLKLSGGTELSFLIAGNESNPPVLLFHGMPNSARFFRGVIPTLAREAYVIAPDLPGHGASAGRAEKCASGDVLRWPLRLG